MPFFVLNNVLLLYYIATGVPKNSALRAHANTRNHISA